MIEIEFEWDLEKEASNISKHGISFIAASKMFLSHYYEARSDRSNETRYLAVGEIENRVISVVYTKREHRYRIISARRAREYEKEAYKDHCEISCTSITC